MRTACTRRCGASDSARTRPTRSLRRCFCATWRGLARSEERRSSPRVCTGSRSLRRSDGARAVLLPLAEADPDGENPIVALPDSPHLRKRASRATLAFVSQRVIELAIPLATSGSRGRLTWHERFAAKQKRRPLFLRECVGLMGRARAAPACGGRAEVVSRVRCAAVRSPTPCDAEPPRLHLAAGHLRRPPHERGRGPRPAGLPGRPFPAGRERGRCSSVRSAGGTPRRKTAHPGPSPAGESTDPRY